MEGYLENKIRWVVRQLAACDPVYGPVGAKRGPNNTKRISIRICALCGAESADQGENVNHSLSCPWLPARDLREQLKGL